MGRPALWAEIYERLTHEIRDGLYPPGEKLPTEAALAARFGVNRHTVRRALGALADEGAVQARQGAGVFVTARPTAYALGARVRFHRNLSAAGKVPGREISSVETRHASAEEARHLALDPGDRVHVCEGISTADGTPMASFRTVFPADLLPEMAKVLEQEQSITRALALCGVPDYTRRETWLSAEIAGAARAAQLRIAAGAALLLSVSVSVDPQGRPVEYGRTWFVGERVQLSVRAGDV